MVKRIYIALFMCLLCADQAPIDITIGLLPHIVWDALLEQTHAVYEVYLYSPTCGHCLAIESDMVRIYLHRAQPPLYVMKTDATIPFGPPKPAGCQCRLEDIKANGYPALFVIENGCLTNLVLGAAQIAAYYRF